ncbi:MAG: J domain-containing protein [Deltaproteobacteria bacterium]|nr:J domain-containing protein [Deltaproteobacteria bacterium]
MSQRDPYSVLGVAKSASDKEIKSAYHKLATALHPDRNPGDARAEARFKEVTAAFSIIGDAEKRALYDEFGADGLREGFNADAARQWKASGGSGGFSGFGGDFSDILSQLFGGGAGGRRGAGGFGGGGFGGGGFGGGGFGGGGAHAARGADEEAEVEVPLSVALSGGKVHLSAQGVDLTVPAGVSGGQRLKLRGKGRPGHGGAGDLLVTVRVAPPEGFVVEGDDLRYDLPLRLSQVALGDRVSVPLPEGGAITLKVPPGLAAQRRVRVPERGLPVKGGGRGHLFVAPYILTPPPPRADDPAALAAFEEAARALDAYY